MDRFAAATMVTATAFETLKLDAHGMRPVRFLDGCVLFRDVMSYSDASGMVCVRVKVSQNSESDAST